ncbi:NAD(P)/FAD-dependent oxidoreductase [Streptomyces sp. NPDC052644]
MYDAIVIGARCSGASTALLLARQGHRVLVVDRASFPSDVISTHFLWPHGMSYLNRWGLLDEVLAVTPAHTTVEVVNDGISLTGSVPVELLREYFRDLHGDDSGVVQSYASVRRRVLDQILVDAAAGAGAEVRTGFTVRELVVEDGQVVGVRGRGADGEQVEERARIVVGADGRNSFVARTLGLPKFDERPRCTFAYWSYWSGFDLGPAQLHRRGRLACAVVPTNFDQNMCWSGGRASGRGSSAPTCRATTSGRWTSSARSWARRYGPGGSARNASTAPWTSRPSCDRCTGPAGCWSVTPSRPRTSAPRSA